MLSKGYEQKKWLWNVCPGHAMISEQCVNSNNQLKKNQSETISTSNMRAQKATDIDFS